MIPDPWAVTSIASLTRVTRWLDISVFGHFQQWKLAQWRNKFAKVDSAFCQIRNKLSKICQKVVNFCQIWSHCPKHISIYMSSFKEQNFTKFGQWLWHSWQRGRFRYQRTQFRIQPSATFIEQLSTVNYFVEKTKIQIERPGISHFEMLRK